METLKKSAAVNGRNIGSFPVPAAALTFDDGPHPLFTTRLLEVLQRHNAKATFFMLGGAALSYPRLVQNVAAAGHAIGNHSWSHPDFTRITAVRRLAEVDFSQRALEPHGLRLFRPPFGSLNAAASFELAQLGYQIVQWDLDPKDWSGRDLEKISADVIDGIRPGSIVLLHDGVSPGAIYEDRQPTIDAVDRILTRLASTYRFLTVPQLFRMRSNTKPVGTRHSAR